MGNETTGEEREWALGSVIDARYSSNGRFYPAQIVRRHTMGRYDVKFISNSEIRTVFSEDLKEMENENENDGNLFLSDQKGKNGMIRRKSGVGTHLQRKSLLKKVPSKKAPKIMDKQNSSSPHPRALTPKHVPAPIPSRAPPSIAL